MTQKNDQKLYKIGQAASLLELKTSVLRHWESEFEQLDPVRTKTGQRLYTEDHLDLLRRIQQLLHKEGMTTEGARKCLEEGHKDDVLREVYSELLTIKELLER
ncbi:MAG: MerR family transcriptional regulator [Desulfovibrio sp.]